jgi:hypothetical protein
VSAMAAAPIAADVLAHLDAQIASARRLLAQILRQSGAIRRRDVDGVLATMTDIQGEMASRGRLDSERTELLWRAGGMLGIPAEAVTLSELTGLMEESDADEARVRSAELRGLLSEVEREHSINRALMRQELSFLEHLTRMLGGQPEAGAYGPGPGVRPRPAGRSPLHVVDYEA